MPDLSYCVVNTNGRDLLLACLDAIEHHHPGGLQAEVLVLDNASDDDSAEAVRQWASSGGGIRESLRLIEQPLRRGKAANDSLLLESADSPFCLLLNEDSELQAEAVSALLDALAAHPRAGGAGARLLDPVGVPQPCAWRLPGPLNSFASALFLHRWVVVQSSGDSTRRVGWVQSAAMLVRREAAAQVGFLDCDYFVYSDETDFAKRLHDGGWEVLFVPAAKAIHHEQLFTDRGAGDRRVVEFHRGRDLYMRKHHRYFAPFARPLAAFPYALRALVALLLPAHDPSWYWLHARQAMRPGRGEGLREAADAYNASSSRRSAS